MNHAEIPPSTRFESLARGAQFRDRIALRVAAPPAAIFHALTTVGLRDMRLAWLVGELRYLPARLAGHPPPKAGDQPFLDELRAGGTLVLVDDAPHELVTGSAGQLHRVLDQAPVQFADRAAFDGFADPAYEKLFMSLRVEPTGRPGVSWLVLDHATLALSPEAERKFARYWRVIRPGGALVSRQLLRAVRRRAEAAAAPPATQGRGLRLASLAGGFLTLLALFLGLVRPWYNHWGTRPEERTRALPGDAIVRQTSTQVTRGITIRAPIERTWPWLAQLGQDRGGFYSFDQLENAVGCAMPTADVLRPEKQDWRLGDKLWMYPPDKAGGVGFAVLRDLVPGRALAFGTHASLTAASARDDGSWTFVLEPLDASTTRLLVRGRGPEGRSWLGRLVDRIVFEPMHFVMERRMMVGLRDVAESGARSRAANARQIVLWSLALVLVLLASLAVLRAVTVASLAALLAAGAAFQLLTLGQPPVWIGLLCLLAVAGALLRGFERPRVDLPASG